MTTVTYRYFSRHDGITILTIALLLTTHASCNVLKSRGIALAGKSR